MTDNTDNSQKLLSLMKEIIQEEKVLRDQSHIGDKFRFIREKLAALYEKTKQELNQFETIKEVVKEGPATDEMLVYVYLFNAQGLSMPTWQKFLNPSVFYEYSVNRPIYIDQMQIESFIRSRSNKMQHGYLTVVIKKTDLLSEVAGQPAQQDVIGNALYKIREGALRFDQLVSFKHNAIDYTVKQNGELIAKSV